jgi:hypothetical protein
VVFRIVWSSQWDQGENVVTTEGEAFMWVMEARDKGADKIVVMKDGEQIDPDDLMNRRAKDVSNANRP